MCSEGGHEVALVDVRSSGKLGPVLHLKSADDSPGIYLAFVHAVCSII